MKKLTANILLRRYFFYLPASKHDFGFGLLEVILSSLILGVIITTSIVITSRYQDLNYRASLREAINQVIDEDMTDIRLKLTTYLYHPTQGNKSACYASSQSCQHSNRAVNQCDRIAYNAVTDQAQNPIAIGLGTKHLPFSQYNQKVLAGLGSSTDLKRTVVVQKPSAPIQQGQSVTRLDSSIVQISYTLQGEVAASLFGSSSKITLNTVDLSPAAHAACERVQ